MKTLVVCGAFLGISCMGQSLILPQIADGADWRTAIVLTNVTTAPATATLTFFQDIVGGATSPWNPPFLETSNTQSLALPAGGTIFLHTPGTEAALTEGWGKLSGAGIVGYAIYTYGAFAGRPDQDGTSPAVAPSSRFLVPFDNTNGFVTSIAVANPTANPVTISVNIQTEAGAKIQATLPTIPAGGHIALITSELLPAMAAHRGLAEFYVTGGNFSLAAFRFNPTLALTSLPVFPQTGAPVIGPQPFLSVNSIGAFSPSGAPATAAQVTITPNGDGTFSAVVSTSQYGSVTLSPGTICICGQSFTFPAISFSSTSNPNVWVSANLTLTLAPDVSSGTSAQGNLNGTLTLVTVGGTYSGSITGTYTQSFPSP